MKLDYDNECAHVYIIMSYLISVTDSISVMWRNFRLNTKIIPVVGNLSYLCGSKFSQRMLSVEKKLQIFSGFDKYLQDSV